MEDVAQEDLEGHPSEYATRDEAEAALSALTPLEKKKLMVAAMVWWKHYRLQKTEVTPDDLLQEAICRTLETNEPRRWRKAVTSIVKHLDRGMESVTSHHRERLDAESRAHRTSRSLDPHKPSPTTSAPKPLFSSDSESQLSAREELENIKEFFGEDIQGYQAVCCRSLGMEMSEILSELGINSEQWDTVRKRVQRKLAKYLSSKEEQ